ncbi:MAG: DUF305 domain-containing protein [Acidimicrobiales bacterium]
MKRSLFVLITIVGVALLAASCGGGAAKDHNARDVSFAQEMIPHHRQAVEMADLAATRASDQKVKALAAQIKAAQDPEIQTMTGWLTSWGEPVTASAGGGGMAGHSMGGSSGSTGAMGMMTDAEMTTLQGSSGVAFDRQFLTMMTGHHNGAIEMAQDQLDKGKFEPAKQLAASIRDSQQKEVAEMQRILAALPTT